jgi:uncharacterized repeat protein (TIGR01451 family)
MIGQSGSTLKALLRSCAGLAAVLALAACDTAQSTAPGTAQPIMFSLDEDMMCTTGGGALGGLSASIMSSSDSEEGTDASSGVSSEIYGMNKDGWASGRVRSGGKWVPAVRDPDGTWLHVTVVDAANAGGIVYDINDNNDFVGYIVPAGAPNTTDVSYWRAIRGTATASAAAAVQISLPAGGSEARSINNTGVVAGTVFQAGKPSQVFRHTGSTYALLERSDNTENARAYGINRHGHIVGSVSEETTSGFGFYHDGSQFIDIAGSSLIARGVNDAGEVVGELKVGSDVRAFIATVTAGVVSPLTLIPLAGSAVQNYAYAINNSGVVVGFDKLSGGGKSAWRWDSRTPGATPVRLAKLPVGCGARAFAINECDVAGGLTERADNLYPLATLWGINNCFGSVPETGMSLVKKTNGTDNNSPTGPLVAVGSTVTWSYTVTNTGNVTLTNIVVRDDNGTSLNTADDFDVCTIASLAEGASHTCTATGTATAGQYKNWGTASTTYDGNAISATDPDHYFGAGPAISLVKLTNGTNNNTGTGPLLKVGSTVTWTYNLTNSGNVALTNVVIRDDNGTPSNTADDFTVCTVASLAAGASRTCTATRAAISGQYQNLGTATGQYNGTTVTATDPDRYFGRLWEDETATGRGTLYPGTSNWFMYTGYTTSKVDLIAGQHHDAGDIFMSRSGSTTTIRIVLHDGWRWEPGVEEALKIHPFDRAPQTYLEPGGFQFKFTLPNVAKFAGTTVTQSGNTVIVTLPGTSAKFYGIHGDIQRYVGN